MKRNIFIIIVVFICALFFARSVFALELESSAFQDGKFIPVQYTGKGEDISPLLKWSGAPKETGSFVLIMDDPDAPVGTWVHWVVYNIPSDARTLKENLPKEEVLGDGTTQGKNSWREIGYGGPNPPPGRAHRYFFKLYATDIKLKLPPGMNKGAILKMIQGHILDEAKLRGLFKR